MTPFTPDILKTIGLMIGLSSPLLLSGCGSSNSTESSSTEPDNGSLELAITDAEEDFLSYQIELEAITLNRTDGTEVSILPLSSEIDFVQYQELSELFAVLSVPKGVYTSITLSLDYTDADIVIQNEAGVSYQAAAVNALGEALAQVEVELTLNDNNPIRITPFKTAQLTLDLDLAASNTIESFEPATVTVEPFMLGTTQLTEDREHRVRGLVQDVDIEDQEISLNIRPMRIKKGEFGEFTFDVNDDTLYEVNGVEYLGSEGLSAIGALENDSPLVAFGTANTGTEQTFLASQVHAGSSVPWSDSDLIKGVITKRVGNILTINGAVLEIDDRKADFHQTIEVSIGENSTVTGHRLGDADINSLSVGQKIIAFGEFNEETANLDATNGNIRMKLNKIVGEVEQVNPLQIDLSHINKRPIDIFDFTGTGISTDDDANPASYEVNTGNLDVNSIDVNEWIQVRGYPSAFSSAPLDFDALSIVNPDFSSHAAKLHSQWDKESTGGVLIENDTLALNTNDARSKLHLVGVPGSSKLEFTVEVISGSQEPGLYGILVRGNSIQVHNDFSEFINTLNAELENGLEARHLTAAGNYSDTDHSLSATYLTLMLDTPALETETD